MTPGITSTDRYECLAALYAARYGRLAPGKDDFLPYGGTEENCKFDTEYEVLP